MPEVEFTLNGNPVVVAHEADESLLEVLRERLGITSAKDGCAPQGFCGCCTVLLAGRPALACLTDAARVAGKEVTTLEGLPEEQRQILAEAFETEGGVQCGFCTPGIAVRASALLERGQAADPGSGQKSTARPPLSNAPATVVLSMPSSRRVKWLQTRVAALNRALAWGFSSVSGSASSAVLGQPRMRQQWASAERFPDLGVRDQVLGAKAFVADLKMPFMLHPTVVLSAHPRALARSIDIAPAAEAPGVERVITAADVPGARFLGLVQTRLARPGRRGRAHALRGRRARGRRRRQPPARPRRRRAIAVEYEVLEPVTEPRGARPEAPRCTRRQPARDAHHRGEDHAAFAESPRPRGDLQTQRVEHAFLEPEACWRRPAAAACTSSRRARACTRTAVRSPPSSDSRKRMIVVELVSNGGAFGGKEDLSVQGHTALAAWLTGARCGSILTASRAILMHPKRHPLDMRYKVGADSDGRLDGRTRPDPRRHRRLCFGRREGPRTRGRPHLRPLPRPGVDIEARAVYTNNPPCGAMRGFGVNQTAFAIEGLLDRLAERVGIDGWDIRERNILREGDRFAHRPDHDCELWHRRHPRGGARHLQTGRPGRHRLRHQEHRYRQRHGRHRAGSAARCGGTGRSKRSPVSPRWARACTPLCARSSATRPASSPAESAYARSAFPRSSAA